MKAVHSSKSHKEAVELLLGVTSELTAGSTTKDDSDYFPSLKSAQQNDWIVTNLTIKYLLSKLVIKY